MNIENITSPTLFPERSRMSEQLGPLVSTNTVDTNFKAQQAP